MRPDLKNYGKGNARYLVWEGSWGNQNGSLAAAAAAAWEAKVNHPETCYESPNQSDGRE